jgi:hypothetical protein
MNRRGWFVILAVVLLVLPASRALGSRTESPDSAWWAELDGLTRAYVVESAIDSYEIGVVDGVWNAAPGNDASIEALSKRLHPHYSHTFGYYSAAISDFYNVHPSASAGTIGEIMSCLSDAPLYTCASVAKRIAAKSS